jgi:hypothetical protein
LASTELMAVVFAGDRVVAVGHACDRIPDTGSCRAAAVVADVHGYWNEAPPSAGLEVGILADGTWTGMRDVVATPGGLLAVGASGVGGRPFASVWTSVDGLSWDRVSEPGAFAEAWMNAVIALDDGSLLAVGGATTPSGGASAASWTSRDGGSWARAPDAPTLAAGAAGAIRAGRPEAGMWDVALVGGRFVAAGAVCTSAAGGCIATTWVSTDGVAWSRVPSAGLGAGSASAVAVSDGAATVLGRGPRGPLSWRLSPDGAVSQRAFQPDLTSDLLTAAWSESRAIAAGAPGGAGGGIWSTSSDAWAFHPDRQLDGATIMGIATEGDRIAVVGFVAGDPAALWIGRLESFEP